METENRLTDEELALEAGNGSEAAFSELVNRHTNTVYRLGYGITGNRQDAEDIVQETFLKAFKHIESFSSDKANFKTWLLVIARNHSINVFSSLKRKTLRFFSSDEKGMQDFPQDANYAGYLSDPEARFEEKQRYGMVTEALNKLPERQRTAIILKAQENLSYEEIAGIMKTSASSVESLIFRARRRLMDILER